MTVTVSIFTALNSKLKYLDDVKLPSPYNDLAGFESSRQTFYIDICYSTIGIIDFKYFNYQDLYVYSEDLFEFLQKTLKIRTYVLNYLDEQEKTYWIFRIDNIIESIKYAMNIPNAGIHIG